jgi:hypothetical protein
MELKSSAQIDSLGQIHESMSTHPSDQGVLETISVGILVPIG